MSLADYLAKNYLHPDPAPNTKAKKRKRRPAPETSGSLVIDDDEALGLRPKGTRPTDDDGPVTGNPTVPRHQFIRRTERLTVRPTVSTRSADFRPAKVSTWKTVGVPAPSSSEQAVADAIIASAAADTAARHDAEDEPPAVLAQDGGETTTTTTTQMESGAHAGLQTAEQVTTAVRRRQADELARFQTQGDHVSGRGQETIYRDASGRIINIAMKRAEARRAAAEAAAKEDAAIEAQKGAVQRTQAHARRQDLDDARYMPFARHADDVDLNRELKDRQRWNDPAARFLTSKKDGRSSVTGKPLYNGPVMPNRYAIRPGHRWDGVDRSNGFEMEYFAAQNKRRDHRRLEYAWQMDE